MITLPFAAVEMPTRDCNFAAVAEPMSEKSVLAKGGLSLNPPPSCRTNRVTPCIGIFCVGKCELPGLMLYDAFSEDNFVLK